MLFQGDLILRQAVKLAIEDMKKQPWLIEDCFSCLIQNPYLRDAYGLKEIQNAKDFIQNNEIQVFMNHRVDKVDFPCVTIGILSGYEDDNEATMSDLSTEAMGYTPEQIDRPIAYIVSPFNPVSFDKTTGLLEIPTDIKTVRFIAPGQMVVNIDTSDAYEITDKGGENGIIISPDADLTGQVAVIPKYCYYKARRERIRSKHTFEIGCHVSGDPSTLIFLFNMVKYGLLRYREALLEANGFEMTSIGWSDLMKRPLETENIYSRNINIKGLVEESWVKGAHRIIESVDLYDIDNDQTGIKFVSNKDSQVENPENEPWLTVEDES